MNDVNVMNEQLNNDIYILSQPVSIMYTSSKCPKISDVSDIYLQYCRLGHVNKNRINRLTQEETLDVSDYKSLSTCESCLLEKMIKSPFTEKDERASEVLNLIYTDVRGSMNTNVRVDIDRKSTRLNSSHSGESRMPSSA